MRTGPRPLMTHLGLALSAQNAENADFTRMMEGIKKYQLHPYVRTMTEPSAIWQEGEVRLLHYPEQGGKQKGAVFVVPSMINRATILDITQSQSFVRWMAGQGYGVYVLDWGQSIQDAGQKNFDALFSDRIQPALKYAAEHSSQKLHIAGYCMGGILAAAAAQLYEEYCASLTLLATPWDFQGGEEHLAHWVQFWAPVGLSSILQFGYLPSDWIQTVFASLDPFQTAKKFAAFAEMSEEDPKAEIFVAVEDWLNDPVHLPGELARVCIKDWFADNICMQGNWKVLGQAIAPIHIHVPVLVVASRNDRLVPYDSAAAFLQEDKDNIQLYEASCGHIGFMASMSSRETIWPALCNFFAASAR